MRKSRHLFVGLLSVIAIISFQVTEALAARTYLHSFNDMIDISGATNSPPNNVISVSSDVAVDGSNSLKFHQTGATLMLLTPLIGGNPNTDDTITMVVRYRAVAAANDYIQMQVNDSFEAATVRGYPTAGNIGVYTKPLDDWVSTTTAWPVGDWFTVAYSLDAVTDTFKIYAKPGTSVGIGDLVGSYTATGLATPTTWRFRSTNGGEPDFYIDQFEIFSNQDEFAVPEPSTMALCGVGLVASFGHFRRAKGRAR